MTSLRSLPRLRIPFVFHALAAALAAATAPAQSAPAPALKTALAEEAVVLSPFEIVADANDSYQANNTLGVTGTNREIKTLPLSMEAITRTFIDDIAANDLIEVLSFAANIQDIQDSGGGGNGEGQQFRLRGLLSKEERRRDGFLTMNRQDTYNLDRVELLRGPQSLLYGQGVTSGALNAVTKRANTTRNSREVQFRTDENGTARATFDVNEGVNGKLGVRVNGLWGDQKFWQENLHTRSEAGTVDVLYRLTPTLRTRGSYEYLETDSVLRPGGTSSDFTLIDNSATEPRAGQRLGALIRTGNTAGIVIAGRPLAWENYTSVVGSNSADQRRDHNLVLAVEGEPLHHFSFRFAFNAAKSLDQKYINNNVRELLAPTDSRAIDRQFSVRIDPSRNRNEWDVQAWQGALVYQLDVGRLVTNQFVLGAETREKNQTYGSQSLYVLDASGNPAAGTQDGGRRRVASVALPVQSGFPGLPDYGPTRWDFRGFPTKRQERQDAVYANWLGTWFQGRLETMAGGRLDQILLKNILEAGDDEVLYDTDETTGMIGAVFNVTRSWGVYVNYGKSFNGASTLRRDPDNQFLPPSSGVGREAGLKLDLFEQRVSGSIAVFDNESKSENVNIGTAGRNVIDAAGINGRNGDVFVPVQLRTRGVEVSLSLRPTRNWRVQISAGTTGGEYGSDVVRPIFYNDQFNTVRLADGSTAVGVSQAGGAIAPLLVPSIRNVASSPQVPLTLDLLRQAPGAATYGATIDPVSGRITNASAIRLTTAGVGTGVTGLPISAHQLGFVAPDNGQYFLLGRDEKTTGFPERSANLNTNYQFTSGLLNGFFAGGTYQVRQRLRQTYVTIGGVRQLYYRPDTQMLGLRFGYHRKFKRVDWRTQINLSNVLQEEAIYTELDANGGIAQVLRAEIPRQLVWTNTFKF